MTTKYKNIEELVLSMASTHGMLHRLTTNEAVLASGMAALEADGVYTVDVEALDKWIGTLTEDQKLTLVDGEEEEMSALVADSPTSELSGICVGQLVEDIYEALEQV